MVTGLLSEKVLSVCIFSFHNMASLLALIVSTGFRSCLYHCSLCNFTPNACMCQSVLAQTLYHISLHIFILPVFGTMLKSGQLSQYIADIISKC